MLDFPGCAGLKVWSNVELDLLLELEYYIGSNSSTPVRQKGGTMEQNASRNAPNDKTLPDKTSASQRDPVHFQTSFSRGKRDWRF